MEPSWTLTELQQRLAAHGAPEAAQLLKLLPELLGAAAPANEQTVATHVLLYANVPQLRQLALAAAEMHPARTPRELVQAVLRTIAAEVTRATSQSLTGQLTAATAMAFPGLLQDPDGFNARGLPDPTAPLGELAAEIPGFADAIDHFEPPSDWRPDFN